MVAVWVDSHMEFSSPFPFDQAHKEGGNVEMNAVSSEAATDFVLLKGFEQVGGGKKPQEYSPDCSHGHPPCNNSEVKKLQFWQDEGAVLGADLRSGVIVELFEAALKGNKKKNGKTKTKNLSLRSCSWHF